MEDKKSSQEDEKPEVIEVKANQQSEDSKEAGSGSKDYFRILTYADKWDWTFNGVGALAAMASGASLAL